MAQIDRALAALPSGESGRSVRSVCLWQRYGHLQGVGRYADALQNLDAAFDAAPPLLRRTQEMAYLRGKAISLNELGKPHAADQGYARVEELMHAAGRERSLRMAYDLTWRGIFRWRMGRPREGVEFTERARATAMATSNGAAAVPFSSLIRGLILLDLDQPEQARQLWESVLLHDGRIVVPFPRAWDFVAPTLRLRGQQAEAVAVLERDLEEHRDSGQIVRDAINRVALAKELLAAHEPSRAIAALAPLDSGTEVPTFRWEKLWLRACAHNMARQPAEAEAAARAAIAEAVQRAPSSGRSSLHGHAYLELARALTAQGRSEESRAAASRAADELSDALGPEHSATKAAATLAQR